MDENVILENHADISTFCNRQLVSGVYIANEMKNLIASNGKPYLKGVLYDNSGRIPFVVWDYDGSISAMENGNLFDVIGSVSVYNDSLQVCLEAIEPIAEEGHDLSSIIEKVVPHAPISAIDYKEDLYSQICSIENDSLRKLVFSIVNGNENAFTNIPAAKTVHHAFVHGLMMHTVDMLKCANRMAEVYSGNVHRDLLIAGCILHDIGKIREFNVNPVTGLVTGYTVEGNAIGHSVIGASIIKEYADSLGFESDSFLTLQHMILSHHGSSDCGAAKEPITLEAELLHCIDMADSRAEIYKENLKNIAPGDFSGFIKPLGKAILNP